MRILASRTPWSALRASTMLLASVVAAVSIGGCAVHTTFPPDNPKEYVDPYFPPMPDVMAKAIKFAHNRLAPNTPLVWNLPAGGRYELWVRVSHDMPEGASAMTSADQDVFSIRQVRISGAKAEVDVVYRVANGSGVWALATVHLCKEGPFQVFQPSYLQAWAIPVEAPTPNQPAKPIKPGTVESAIASDPSIPAGK